MLIWNFHYYLSKIKINLGPKILSKVQQKRPLFFPFNRSGVVLDKFVTQNFV